MGSYASVINSKLLYYGAWAYALDLFLLALSHMSGAEEYKPPSWTQIGKPQDTGTTVPSGNAWSVWNTPKGLDWMDVWGRKNEYQKHAFGQIYTYEQWSLSLLSQANIVLVLPVGNNIRVYFGSKAVWSGPTDGSNNRYNMSELKEFKWDEYEQYMGKWRKVYSSYSRSNGVTVQPHGG